MTSPFTYLSDLPRRWENNHVWIFGIGAPIGILSIVLLSCRTATPAQKRNNPPLRIMSSAVDKAFETPMGVWLSKEGLTCSRQWKHLRKNLKGSFARTPSSRQRKAASLVFEQQDESVHVSRRRRHHYRHWRHGRRHYHRYHRRLYR